MAIEFHGNGTGRPLLANSENSSAALREQRGVGSKAKRCDLHDWVTERTAADDRGGDVAGRTVKLAATQYPALCF